ncbi:AraC family transcriptional regulator [Paenibacillus sp. 32O-W]|uniref:helix-turn-helix transcriptional regulator n=1 Tax=Paenibacillus sp. 32O-W TaxID=1695218 RepID=UPI000720DB2A|nr:AraC family transcriptional regulator [Paenibacillus sp. 32O-W]ALS29264.1 AraC family transcriptional regulator [Paenibacillus sp. 32O-W]
MEPQRLTNEQYLGEDFPLRLYNQMVPGPVALHWHEFYELCYVYGGAGSHTVNGRTVPLSEGSLFLLTPADFHSVSPSPDRPLQLYNAVFGEQLLSDELRPLLFRDYAGGTVTVAEDAREAVAEEFRLLQAELSGRQPGYRLMARGALERILLMLARLRSLEEGSGSGREEAPQPEHIRRALVFIHHRFREPLSLRDAAAQAGLAPNYFSECFRKAAGVPFQQYLQELRLSFACSLLRGSPLPVTDICYASGFRTLSHFERAYKRKYGHSPREARMAGK